MDDVLGAPAKGFQVTASIVNGTAGDLVWKWGRNGDRVSFVSGLEARKNGGSFYAYARFISIHEYS